MDHELVARPKAGDSVAFDELYEAHAPNLRRLARRILRNRDDADDVLQNAFIKVFRFIGGFREGCTLGAWLWRIVFNEALMEIRARRTTLARHITAPAERWLDAHRSHPAAREYRPWADPVKTLINAELGDEVRRALRRVPRRYSRAFALRHLYGLPITEVARKTRTPINTAKNRTHRGKAAMAVELGHWRTA